MTSRHFNHVPTHYDAHFFYSMMRRMKKMSKLKLQQAEETAEAAEAII
jgi:hypothetical protein